MATAQPDASINTMASANLFLSSNSWDSPHSASGFILLIILLKLNKPIPSIWRRTVSKVASPANHKFLLVFSYIAIVQGGKSFMMKVEDCDRVDRVSVLVMGEI